MSVHALGMLSLNMAFVLYLFVFIPQIWHNRRLDYLQNLSPVMHVVLYFGVLCDLFYGFSNHFEWQYRAVSAVSLCVLSVQQAQLIRFFYQSQRRRVCSIYILLSGLVLSGLVYFFVGVEQSLSPALALTAGYLSRVCYQLYAIPQIVKNIRLRDASGISRYFLLINTMLLVLDLISGWCLDWGWPAKLSPPISLVMMGILLYQRRYFAKSDIHCTGVISEISC
jgi:uncharacterized protein with PQ loop repeat